MYQHAHTDIHMLYKCQKVEDLQACSMTGRLLKKIDCSSEMVFSFLSHSLSLSLSLTPPLLSLSLSSLPVVLSQPSLQWCTAGV